MTDDSDVAPDDGRDETANERSDRNWTELLQEFRVVQTGTQILAGFLLTLPFQQRFTTLDTCEITVFVTAVVLAALVTVLAIGPVSVHRLLFRQREKGALVHVSQRILLVCLALASLLFTTVSLLVLDLTLGRLWGIVGAAVVLAIALSLWTVIPATLRRRRTAVER